MAGYTAESTAEPASGIEGDQATGSEEASLVAPPGEGRQQHCVIILDKLHPGESESRVVSHECFDDLQSLSRAAETGTLLMSLWQDANFQGDSTQIRGDYGGCDVEGYGIENILDWWWGEWSADISSFRTYNYCNVVSTYEDEDYGGQEMLWWAPGAFGVRVHYVGT